MPNYNPEDDAVFNAVRFIEADPNDPDEQIDLDAIAREHEEEMEVLQRDDDERMYQIELRAQLRSR